MVHTTLRRIGYGLFATFALLACAGRSDAIDAERAERPSRVVVRGEVPARRMDDEPVRAELAVGALAVEAEVALGGGESDEDRRVDLWGEGGGVEDAGEVEPHPSQPDALAGVEPVDAEGETL